MAKLFLKRLYITIPLIYIILTVFTIILSINDSCGPLGCFGGGLLLALIIQIPGIIFVSTYTGLNPLNFGYLPGAMMNILISSLIFYFVLGLILQKFKPWISKLTKNL
jgi:hypothetical protein